MIDDEHNLSAVTNPYNLKIQEAILKLGKEEQETLKDIDWAILLNPENKVYYKAEEIAKELGKGWTSTKVNEILVKMKFQIKLKDDYYPTIKGVESGCFHRGMFLDCCNPRYAFKLSIMWTIDVVDIIKEYLSNNKEEDKNGTK